MTQNRILHVIIAALVVVATLWSMVHWWPGSESDTGVKPGEEIVNRATTLVRLSEGKASVAGIRTERISRRAFDLTRTLPARFAYDDRRHVALRAPTDGVIESVLAKPGDTVEAGQSIAVLCSPDVGNARSEVLRRQAQLDLIEVDRQLQSAVRDGVIRLVREIRAGKAAELIQQDLGATALGQYRQPLLTSYSRLRLAEDLSRLAAESSGAISGRILRERQTDQQTARAELDGAIEHALFAAEQEWKSTTSATDAAKRSLAIARQELATLLGMTGDRSAKIIVSPNETDLARLDIRSPIAGTVERRVYSATERVTAGAELFTVADTSQLWVEADVRERDWSAMIVQEGDPVTVTTPADPQTQLAGTVHYVGREVDRASGAVPLVVAVANELDRYRPGLFARVEVPVDQIADAVVVPDSAVLDLEGRSSVFVAEGDGYRPVEVELGRRSADQVEILSGVEAGQLVVVEGAFVLKSELLLEGEE